LRKKLNEELNVIYSNIENLVLWARSELNGSATIKTHGVLEYWNVGILGLAD
jgi:hypothetical protein